MSYKQMDTKRDIEKQLKQLKSHYQVPDGYFENFEVPKTRHFKIKSSWMIAAGLLLLISLGYELWHWQQADRKIPQNNIINTQVTQNNDLFKDLNEDEIIDYLSDEDPDLEFEL